MGSHPVSMASFFGDLFGGPTPPGLFFLSLPGCITPGDLEWSLSSKCSPYRYLLTSFLDAIWPLSISEAPRLSLIRLCPSSVMAFCLQPHIPVLFLFYNTFHLTAKDRIGFFILSSTQRICVLCVSLHWNISKMGVLCYVLGT